MAYIANQLVDLIGNTPLLRLNGLAHEEGLQADVVVKLEYFNPLGSIKDRVAYAMIKDAETRGILTKDSTIIEPTSGNTGIGLAFVSAVCGYKLILVMPETMSVERRNLLTALGAQLVLTDGAKGMTGAIDKAQELCRSTPGGVTLGQFDNPANPAIHKVTTAVEIWDDVDGEMDIFVAGIGTGGTLSGVGEVLKMYRKDIQVVGVEPLGSAVLSGKEAGPHRIQGIGAGFVPPVLNTDILDEVIAVSDEDALTMMRQLARLEGLLVGISSGAAVFAACQLAKREENRGKRIVVICPDSGERYLSMGVYH
ncbi:MAG: cysteine synthase A [Turicibacter sp.]|uniref:cysteine synthase A n=1 Tax=unclassified Turicibacter TaxID=2638206 RepID=UPI00137B324E|nr:MULTISPECIES: cysteine synthase A [unclassified Turicibacter]MCI9350380.1 cysteine synthase A [Turicibacter sp.]MCU7209991.1 cysteine synthase A [Turicibacter sp. 1E2]NCE77829.1 cysteine synthase A [Turicibacter sp. TS3]